MRPSPQHSLVAAPPPSASFDDAYRAHYDDVRRFLHRLGARGADLPELVQECFVTALKRWNTFDPTRAARPWLFGIAFRVHADFRARARHGSEVLETFDAPASGDDPERTVAGQQRAVLFQRALATLDETKRATFLLHFGEGLSPAELAEALELPIATIYTRLRTARLELTEAVKRLEGGRHE